MVKSISTNKMGGDFLYNKEEYVVVDLETTGLDPFSGDEIIEIGVTEIKKDKIVLNYSKLIKPNGIISSKITSITNITNDMVSSADRLEDVLPNFRRYLGNRTLIAHITKFDVKFLNYYLEKYNLEPIHDYICTMDMLKRNKFYTEKRKNLETACRFFGIQNENAHRADSDTLATAQLFLIIKNQV